MRKKNLKSALAMFGAAAMTLSSMSMTAMAETTAETNAPAAAETTEGSLPKYIFLFIGDGMSYPQVQLTSYYMGAVASEGGVQSEDLSFSNFESIGSIETFDSTSFCPDSASTATSLATGNKTYSGTINMDTTMTVAFETIAEKLKAQKDYKIGVLSTVNLNHATPAAFYAHQASRGSYYEIGEELVASGFDYFAGGALLKPTGSDEDKKDLYELAAESGYTVVRTQAEAEALTAESGKILAISETLADSNAMSYSLDVADENEWQLADYVEKGIEVLDNETGFFMMVEGGKIDWACHANDAASTIYDTIALSDAVQKALDFYNEHPDETLILVTGDHETGGLTIGYAGTNYDTFLTNISNQKISYAKYDSDYVAGYIENGTDFDTVMADVTELFGLIAPDGSAETEIEKDSADQHPDQELDGTLVMTDYEYELLKASYDTTMTRAASEEETEYSQAEYLLYGSYEPLTVTITHILNNKSGINFASYAHTGLTVPVFAQGAGSELFDGYYDNTDIYNKLAALTGVE